jgi:hypothetical protein
MTFTSPKQDGPSLMISGDFDVPSSVISKIASPEKPKTDATENGQRIAPDNTQILPTIQKDVVPIKRLFGDDIDQRTPLLRNTSSVQASVLG